MQDMWQSSYVQHDQDELCLSRYNMEHSSFYTRLVDATRAVNIHKKQNSLVSFSNQSLPPVDMSSLASHAWTHSINKGS